MSILLDTHAALWWWEDSPSLGAKARDAIANPDNEVYFSAASGYEIFQKFRSGRLQIPTALQTDLPAAVLAEGWKLLPLTVQEACAAATIDHSHRDPFDRMLATQVQLGDFKIASVDPFFIDLGIPTIW
jgi:PIN domain nuclease of toxin-antitoxin system